MKNFLQHLTEVQKTYEFRIKIANIDPTDTMDRLESALDAYGLESISKPKRLPIAENVLDFPSFGPTEVYIVDATLTYPVTDAQLRQLVSERWGVNVANIVVVPRCHPEELWRNNEGELRQFKKGESVLANPCHGLYDNPIKDNPLEDSPEGKKLGKSYAEAGTLLKELNKVKWEVAGHDNTDGAENKKKVSTSKKTLNNAPQYKNSPMGSLKSNNTDPLKGQ